MNSERSEPRNTILASCHTGVVPKQSSTDACCFDKYALGGTHV